MKEKRFKIGVDLITIEDTNKEYGALNQDEVVKLLNELCEENEQLKKRKARYKRLSEIRNEEINNRILTIKEFIDNCSNEEVKKALVDLFYSEVNEYDLSKKYRKLHEENEDLKERIEFLEHQLHSLTGLWASDKEDMSYPFRLEFNEFMKK